MASQCPKCGAIMELGRSTKCLLCGATIAREPAQVPARRPTDAKKHGTRKKQQRKATKSPAISRRTLILSLAGVGVVVVLTVIVFAVSAYRKATSLETRLAQLASEKESEVATAKAALEKAGTQAAPYLVRGLRGESAQARKHCLEMLKTLGADAKSELKNLREGLTDNRTQVQIACANAIGYLGADGREAESDLFRLLNAKEAEVRSAAFQTATMVGSAEKLMPWLIERIGKGEKQQQIEALERCATCGSKAKAAVPAIIPLIDAKDAVVQRSAFAALEKIGHPDPDLLNKLAGLVAVSQPSLIRLLAVRTMGGLGIKAVPLLTGILAFESRQVSFPNHAFELRKIAEELQKRRLSNEDFKKELQKESLRLIRATPIHHPDARIIKETANSLGRIGPTANQALPQLQQSLEFTRKQVERLRGQKAKISHGTTVYGKNGVSRRSPDSFTMEIPLDRPWIEAVSSIESAIAKINAAAKVK